MNGKDRKKYQYWIDRSGRIRKYKGTDEQADDRVSLHYEIISDIFPNIDDPNTHAMKLGWILVGSTVYHSPIIHKSPSQSQMNTLFDLNLWDKLTILHNGYYVNYSDKIGGRL